MQTQHNESYFKIWSNTQKIGWLGETKGQSRILTLFQPKRTKSQRGLYLIGAQLGINKHLENSDLLALLAVSLAASLCLDRFIIEGDFHVVILVLQHPLSFSRLEDFFVIISDSSFQEAKKINRSINFYAHYVTCWAASIIFLTTFLLLLPLSPMFLLSFLLL